MLAALLAVALSTFAPLPGDCAACAPAKLCGPHARVEGRLLGSVRGYLVSNSIEVRIVTLEGAAKLTLEHENAPSPRVARFLAEALELREHESVRARALQLLASGQHVDTAIDEIARLLDKAVPALARGPQEGKPEPKPADGPQDVDEARKRLKRDLKRFTNDLKRGPKPADPFLAAVHSIQHGLEAIAAIGTSEARKVALRAYERVRKLDGFDGTFAAALLGFGTRDVFRVAIEVFVETGSDGVPQKLVGPDGTERLVHDKGDPIHAALLAAVESRGLPKPELAPGRPAREAWLAWLAAHGVSLPEAASGG